MSTQSAAILELPPTDRAREAVREAFDGAREIGAGTEDLETTAVEMAARMIDSARHAAIDAVNEVLDDRPQTVGGSIKVFVFGTLFGVGLVTLAFLMALAALHFGSH